MLVEITRHPIAALTPFTLAAAEAQDEARAAGRTGPIGIVVGHGAQRDDRTTAESTESLRQVLEDWLSRLVQAILETQNVTTEGREQGRKIGKGLGIPPEAHTDVHPHADPRSIGH